MNSSVIAGRSSPSASSSASWTFVPRSLSGDVLHCVGPPEAVVELAEHRACGLPVRGLELGFAVAGATASAGGSQPVAGAFGERVTLELADGVEHREEHAAGGS
jgi:hypothetical protein